jgi:hypothetical protein
LAQSLGDQLERLVLNGWPLGVAAFCRKFCRKL